MSRHSGRRDLASWFPAAWGSALIALALVLAAVAGGRHAPTPVRTVLVPGPTVTSSFLIYVTAAPTDPADGR